MRDRSNAALSVDQVVPKGLKIVAHWRDDSHSCDDDSAVIHWFLVAEKPFIFCGRPLTGKRKVEPPASRQVNSASPMRRADGRTVTSIRTASVQNLPIPSNAHSTTGRRFVAWCGG
jgi:hypothetical protein